MSEEKEYRPIQCALHQEILENILTAQEKTNEELRSLRTAIHGADDIDERKPGLRARVERLEGIIKILLWVVTAFGAGLITAAASWIAAKFGWSK